jgi:hypothetical protein
MRDSSPPGVIDTRTEERDGQTFTVTVLEDAPRPTDIPVVKWRARKKAAPHTASTRAICDSMTRKKRKKKRRRK